MYYVRFREYNGNGTNYQTDYFKTEDYTLVEKYHKERQEYHGRMPGRGYSDLTDLTMDFTIDKFYFELAKNEIKNLFKLNVKKCSREYCFSNSIDYGKVRKFQRDAVKELDNEKFVGINNIIGRLFKRIEFDKIIKIPFSLKKENYNVIGAMSDELDITFTDKQIALLEALKRLENKILEFNNYNLLL